MFEDNLGNDKDVINLALKKNPRVSRKDYEEVYKHLKNFMEQELRNGEHTSYWFPYIGTLYIRLKEASENFIVKPKVPYEFITNWQKRYEKILKEILERTHDRYRTDRRQLKNTVEKIEYRFGIDLEDLEERQRPK